MGKSAVLKDITNHPAGYLRMMDGAVFCRTQMERPAELALVYADGSQHVYIMEEGNFEQRFACKGDITGCYVFRGEKLLLFSDESMRCAFEKWMGRKKACVGAADERGMQRNSVQPDVPEKEMEDREKKQHVFAQRRWPPPPCLCGVHYRNGCWQEE